MNRRRLIKKLASDVVQCGDMVVNLKSLSPKAKNELFDAIIEVMAEQGMILDSGKEDLTASVKSFEQFIVLLNSDGEKQ